jgi:hypothetical protein
MISQHAIPRLLPLRDLAIPLALPWPDSDMDLDRPGHLFQHLYQPHRVVSNWVEILHRIRGRAHLLWRGRLLVLPRNQVSCFAASPICFQGSC